MGTEISKAEKHLCQGSKRCVDLMGLCLIFTNNWWLRMYLSLQAKFLPINLADWIITYNIIYTKSLEFGNVKWTVSYCLVSTCESSCYSNIFVIFPVDTRRCFNVYKSLYDVATSCRRLLDVETTSCVYWVSIVNYMIASLITRSALSSSSTFQRACSVPVKN